MRIDAICSTAPNETKTRKRRKKEKKEKEYRVLYVERRGTNRHHPPERTLGEMTPKKAHDTRQQRITRERDREIGNTHQDETDRTDERTDTTESTGDEGRRRSYSVQKLT